MTGRQRWARLWLTFCRCYKVQLRDSFLYHVQNCQFLYVLLRNGTRLCLQVSADSHWQSLFINHPVIHPKTFPAPLTRLVSSCIFVFLVFCCFFNLTYFKTGNKNQEWHFSEFLYVLLQTLQHSHTQYGKEIKLISAGNWCPNKKKKIKQCCLASWKVGLNRVRNNNICVWKSRHKYWIIEQLQQPSCFRSSSVYLSLCCPNDSYLMTFLLNYITVHAWGCIQ